MIKSSRFRHASVPVYVLILLLHAGCTSSGKLSQPATNSFSFALIGDMPYYPQDDAKFDRLQAEVNADPSIAWVLHAGDIKTGGAPCSDAYLEGRLESIQRFSHPVIYTPGDNEWTDCHRETAGGHQPLERLAKLRSLFFPKPGLTLGQRSMTLTSQASQQTYAEFPENTLWIRDGVVFAAIHLVGSMNGMMPFPGRSVADDNEAERRMNAALSWLQKAFDEANNLNSPGIFLMMHANPGFEMRTTGSFKRFIDALEVATINFGKPVVLAHGDSHYFRIDKPLMGSVSKRRIEHFTRVETFGALDVHWLRVNVYPDDSMVFHFQQQIVNKNLDDHLEETR